MKTRPRSSRASIATSKAGPGGSALNRKKKRTISHSPSHLETHALSSFSEARPVGRAQATDSSCLRKPAIGIVVPSNRSDCLEGFKRAWQPLFDKHEVSLICVRDAKDPMIEASGVASPLSECLPEFRAVLFRGTSAIRQAGFAFVAKHRPDIDVLVTLDDDVAPRGDPITDHLAVLGQRESISWFQLASEYTRGFPYEVRQEAVVTASHGVWTGIYDYDAPTQLVRGNPPIAFYKGPVPKGSLTPVCGMNFAFSRSLLPYVYFAPMLKERYGFDRFDDIWMGIRLKRHLDQHNQALYTGASVVMHAKASNVFANLEKEAKGIRLNETYWKGDESDPYFAFYNEKYEQWKRLVLNCGSPPL